MGERPVISTARSSRPQPLLNDSQPAKTHDLITHSVRLQTKNPPSPKGTAGCRGTTLVCRYLTAAASVSTGGKTPILQPLITVVVSGRVYWGPTLSTWLLRDLLPRTCDAAFQQRGSLWSPSGRVLFPSVYRVLTCFDFTERGEGCQGTMDGWSEQSMPALRTPSISQPGHYSR